MTTTTTSGAADLRKALVTAEAALADIGDADREPGDDVAWCEARAAEALPEVRAALAAAPAQPVAEPANADSVQEDAARYRHLRNKSHLVHNKIWLGGISAYNRDGDFLCRDDALAALDTAIDTARKQGASHDR